MSRFTPPKLLSHRHLQSVWAGAGPRRWTLRLSARGLERRSTSHVLDCGDGVRLQGRHTAAHGSSRGLVILLHGWLGSARSTYVLSLARLLSAAGFDLFRLNYRDHGETHALNEGLFHSCRLDEVVGAVAAIGREFPARPLQVVGFSLGGNFALRVALRAPGAGLELQRAVAVNPVIDPAHVMQALESAPAIYGHYFEKKWRRELRLKQAAFPECYDFAEWMSLAGLRERTDYLVSRYHAAEFASLAEYLRGYSIAGDRLRPLEVPATVITAADDPVVPVQDFHALDRPASVDLEIQPHGGHCGYLTGPFSTWIDGRILAALGG